MGKIILALLLVIPFLIIGKETRKITHKCDSPAFKEVFYVLKSDTSIKHGSYQAVSGRRTMIKGSYKMGLKDSIWIQYNHQGKMRSIGWYEKGIRARTWEFFDNKGQLEQKIDFSRDNVIFYQTKLANHLFKIILAKDTAMCLLDRPPMYIGGMCRYNDCVARELNVNPLHKLGENVRGIVYVAFTIDSMGKTSHHRILKGIGKVCNEEAIRVIRAIPDDWLPGILNGKSVSVDFIVPFQFNIDHSKSKTQFEPILRAPNFIMDHEGEVNGPFLPGWGGMNEVTPE